MLCSSMRRFLTIAIAAFFFCGILFSVSAIAQECTDSDADGYYYEDDCETVKDCNDANASIHPEAEEMCNGYDANCNGLLDDGCDTICDHPYTLGSDVRITEDPCDSFFSSIVWTGDEYGISWIEEQYRDYEIYFARFDQSGYKIGSEARVTWDPAMSSLPSLVWTGSEYGISWTDERNGYTEIYFARLDRSGNKIGSDIRITWDNEISFFSSIVWTGKEYGIAWLDARSGYFGVYFCRLDSFGNKIGTDIPIAVFDIHSYRRPVPALVWTGSEYGISWQVFQDGNYDIYFARLDRSGNKIGSDIRVVRVIERVSFNFPSLVWTGSGYGISWDEERDGNYEIYFARLNPSGNKISSDIRVTWDPANCYFPSLVWTGSEYGISWNAYQDGKDDIYFARLDPSGNKVGSDLKVSLQSLNYHEPSTVWTGNEYGVFLNDSRSGSAEIYFQQIHCSQALSAHAGEDSTSECTSFSGAMMTLDGSASTDVDSSPGTNDDIVAFEWFEYYGSPNQIILGTGEILDVSLPLGKHISTLKVTDSAGQTDIDKVIKAAVDTTPPDISVSVTPDTLWPPDHKLIDIEATVVATDICSAPVVVLSSIVSDEPDDAPGNGDGHTINDIQEADIGTADFNFKLRAERSGMGDGRSYTVTYTATDLSGNSSSASSAVNVPHDKK